MSLSITLPALVFMASPIAQAVPAQLAHQGRLLDADDVPLEGENDLNFRIFDDPNNGYVQWEETHTLDLVNGYYSVILGAQESANPLDSAILESTTSLYLELTVNSNSPMQPRHQLVSAPFAILADTARNLSGGTVDASEIRVDGELLVDSSGTWMGETPDSLANFSCQDSDLLAWDATLQEWACANDQDTQLSEPEVDTMVSNNGYALSGSLSAIATSGDWSDLQSVPSDLADGDNDTQLSESQVDGYVSNNGYALSGSLSAIATSGDWSDLQSVPSDLADGDDELGESQVEGYITNGSIDLASGSTMGSSGLLTENSTVGLSQLDTTGASSNQVLSFDGSAVAWAEPAASVTTPCGLASSGSDYLVLDCGGTEYLLKTLEQGYASLGESLYQHSCGVRDDSSVSCWGNNSYGGASPPSDQFSQVTSGWWHSCGLKTDGNLECWGWNTYGQTNSPSGTYTQVTTGSHHSCAVQTSGSLSCWGMNTYGQATAPTGSYTQADAGHRHTCALKTDNTIDCWGGNNNYGEATAPSGNYNQISLGRYSSCAIDGGQGIRCWGFDSDGLTSNSPTGNFTQVSAGDYVVCAIATDGSLSCWGKDDYGQTNPPSGSFQDVTVGYQHACAIPTNGKFPVCWGDGSDLHNSPPY